MILKVYSRKILIVNHCIMINTKMPRENERYAYLSVIILHSIINNK